MKLEACQNLFATPVLSFSLPDADRLNAELMTEIAAMRAASAGVQKTNKQGWHSKGGVFTAPEGPMRELSDHIREAFFAATRLIAPNFDIDAHEARFQGWVNVNPKGGYNIPHVHPGHQWSGCYYVAQPEVSDGTSGVIEFLDPRGSLADVTMLKAPAFGSAYRLRPAAGTLLVFPSYLVHWVHPNQQDADRVSIAWNGRFKRRQDTPAETD